MARDIICMYSVDQFPVGVAQNFACAPRLQYLFLAVPPLRKSAPVHSHVNYTMPYLIIVCSPIPDEYLEKDTPQPPTRAIKREPIITSDTQTVEDIHVHVPRMRDASTLPVKREREESMVSVYSELQNQTSKKAKITDLTLSIEEGSQGSPMEQDPRVSLPSRIEILDSELDDSVIDLTQDV